MGRAFASTDRVIWASRATPTAITFACWVKAEGTGPWTNSFPRAAEFGGGGSVFNVNVSGTPVMRLERGGTSQSNGIANLDNGSWHHLLWTSDGTDEQFFYDGSQVTNSSSDATGNTTTGELRLGNRTSDAARPLDMIMAYPQAYDVVLNSTQITTLQTDAWLDIANLIFNAGADCDHDTVADVAGTITGTTLHAADNPSVNEPGGAAVTLDGTATGLATGAGALALALPLTGISTALATGAGVLALTQSLSGTSTGVASVTGEITIEGTVAFDGSAAGVATGAGALSVALALTGTAAGVATGAGTLLPDRGVAGTATGTAGVTGELTVTAAPTTVHEITTGAMQGGSGAGFDPQAFYVRANEGAWELTYAAHPAPTRGKLMNARMINAVWDNPTEYGAFDPDASTADFISHLAEYKSYGLLAFTIGLQGGNIANSQTAGNASAFNDDGTADLDGGTFASPGVNSWWHRLGQVIEACDDLGLYVIVSIFYFGQDDHLTNNDACRTAVEQTAAYLIANGYRNTLVDIVNEWTGDQYLHSILNTNANPNGVAELIQIFQDEFTGLGWQPPAGASLGGIGSGAGHTGAVATQADIVLPHGNGSSVADVTTGMAWHVANQAYPAVVNEDHADDHNYTNPLTVNQTFLDLDLDKMAACFNEGGSWGMMLYGYNQAHPFEWDVGTSDDISGGSEANYMRAVLDGMLLLVGEAGVVTLAGTATGVGTASGALSATKPLTGTADGSASVDGVLSITRGLTATATGIATADADVGIARALDSTADGTATVGGALLITRGLDAAVAGTATADGLLLVARALSGTAAGEADLTGELSIEGSVNLAASAAGVATASAEVALALALDGSSAGVATADGDALITRGLTASASGEASATGELTTTREVVTLDGTAAGTATATADLSLLRIIDGSAAGSATAAAELAVMRQMIGSAAGVASVTGELLLEGEVALDGSVAGLATTTGVLHVARPLTGTAAGLATASGVLTVPPDHTIEGGAGVIGRIEGGVGELLRIEGGARTSSLVSG